ncbi:unnamed protein product [Protopolystoma xenopodis]|uniref:TOG domain-containing protein n=1 Tax=Protopolystoma xenopodis TaxID=117903 RepID=A0A448WH89_9PLAT|nr:unnamed protein product [Protopolystoma xenopodis]
MFSLFQACSPLALPNEPNQQSIQQLNLPGFSDPDLPISSLIKLYADCILHGRVSLKETAAQGLAECVALADGCAMQRCVVKVIGPMIRLLGERHSNVVRFAVIEALVLLMSKCTMATRPFVTQLQATFAKSLGDPNRPSRLLAGRGLVNLASMTPKLDVLLVDLAKAAASSSLVTACLPTRSAGAAKVISSASGLRTPSQAVTGVSLYPYAFLNSIISANFQLFA